MDTSDRSRLLAAERTVEEIRQFLEVDSIAYLSIEGLLRASGGESFCTACLTGAYPTEVHIQTGKFALETS